MSKSVLKDAHEVQLASTLISLGARLQFLEGEVALSRERLVRLYREIKGASPPKGLLPFSVDWYMTWLANIHASLFYNIYEHRLANSDGDQLQALIGAYQMYLEQVQAQGQGEGPILDFTRAHTLVRFFASKMLQLTPCTKCTGHFVAHAYDSKSDYVCVLCRPPSRAGKLSRTRRVSDPGESAGSGAADARMAMTHAVAAADARDPQRKYECFS